MSLDEELRELDKKIKQTLLDAQRAKDVAWRQGFIDGLQQAEDEMKRQVKKFFDKIRQG